MIKCPQNNQDQSFPDGKKNVQAQFLAVFILVCSFMTKFHSKLVLIFFLRYVEEFFPKDWQLAFF